MKKTTLFILCILTLIGMLYLSGCSSAQSSSTRPLTELVIPKVTTELTSQPASPKINEDSILTIHLLEDVNVRGGMRIELRNNSLTTKIFNATEIEVEEGMMYEVNVQFEQKGENEIYLHFNVDDTHMMQKKTIEVLP
ncbi:MAG: hypothetical protein NAG76_01235 [Candidatus Pristimantibacillus lignocellulolyticus]|uniref:YtkA-like domain-containing protein n=1 Tax=Candidatus Pristimantibacillus lignocellulolyticus TaxID=2994561 RepID=A0A9J6ZFU7_9BACL|nr:MAG: hypothetical protein NAG76_01235 [Candidatus Pristimantibacillus lignocellulolyticus]